jgi:hypothetical protein
MAASLAGLDVRFKCQALNLVDIVVEVRHQGFVAIRRVSTKNVSHMPCRHPVI